MGSSVAEVFLTCVALLLVGLTIWEGARGWLRLRDRYRLDILIVLFQLASVLVLGRATEVGRDYPWLAAIFAVVLLSQPFFLFRLVARFQPVPAPWWVTSVAAPVAGLLATRADPTRSPVGVVALSAYFVVSLSYIAWAFQREARRATGVASARLRLTAAGTWLHVAMAAMVGLETLVPSLHTTGPAIRWLLGLGVFACYFAGLVAPRPLRAIWAQRQIYRYVRVSSDRPPEARAENAADHLCREMGLGVVSSTQAVLLFDPEGPGTLACVASSDPSWESLVVKPGGGLVARALAGTAPVGGAPGDCEPALASVAASKGARVWVSPLVATARPWGVAVVTQPHGSLFPDDDAEYLELLCRHAAVTLDHARLIVRDRDYQRRAAEERLRDTQSRYSIVLDLIRDYAVVITDDRGDVLEWKAGAGDLFRYEAAQVIGTSAARLFVKTGEEFHELLLVARTLGLAHDQSSGRRADHSVFPASTTIHLLPADRLGASGYILVTQARPSGA